MKRKYVMLTTYYMQYGKYALVFLLEMETNIRKKNNNNEE